MSLAHVIYNVHALVADRLSQVNITALVMVCYRLGGVSKQVSKNNYSVQSN